MLKRELELMMLYLSESNFAGYCPKEDEFPEDLADIEVKCDDNCVECLKRILLQKAKKFFDIKE